MTTIWVGELAHDRQVVADQDVGDAGLVADVGEQVQHLGLDRDVQRGHRLVQDQHLGLGRQRAGDRHPLALPAGQRPRQGVHLAIVQAHHVAQLGRPSCCDRRRFPMVQLEHLRRWPRPPTGAGRGWSRDPGTRSGPRAARSRRSLTLRAGLERSLPATVIVPAVGCLQPHDHARHGGLARAGFAHHRQRLALLHLERHVVDGDEIAELLGQTRDREHRLSHAAPPSLTPRSSSARTHRTLPSANRAKLGAGGSAAILGVAAARRERAAGRRFERRHRPAGDGCQPRLGVADAGPGSGQRRGVGVVGVVVECVGALQSRPADRRT